MRLSNGQKKREQRRRQREKLRAEVRRLEVEVQEAFTDGVVAAKPEWAISRIPEAMFNEWLRKREGRDGQASS